MRVSSCSSRRSAAGSSVQARCRNARSQFRRREPWRVLPWRHLGRRQDRAPREDIGAAHLREGGGVGDGIRDIPKALVNLINAGEMMSGHHGQASGQLVERAIFCRIGGQQAKEG